jgi:heme peroxidase
MRLTRHGQNALFEGGEAAIEEVNRLSANMDGVNGVVNPVARAIADGATPFVFLFPELQSDASNLVYESSDTEKALEHLGDQMRDVGLPTATRRGISDSVIPSAYTYFGQFVDHDITSEQVIAGVPLNFRSPSLDLDSVYGPGSVKDEEGKLMKLDRVVSSVLGRVPDKDDEHDLPREDSEDSLGWKAMIGESRNDENLIIAQLHVAFLRAHNNAVTQLGLDFNEARTLIRQHYQCIVLNDFLKKIADPDIVDKTREKNKFFFPKDPLCMPMEFSLAAFRFGHSMVRRGYTEFNQIHSSAPLDMLFTFTGRGGFSGKKRLPADWIIDWKSFVDVGQTFNAARRIDTTLIPELFNLRGQGPSDLQSQVKLSVRNLLRGYKRDLPTGQAIAERMKITPLTATQIEFVAKGVSPELSTAVKASKFTTQTPLWFYILAEAAHYKDKAGRLGPVGSTIVAEVLIEILRRSEDSILGPRYTKEDPWRPHTRISTEGECNLSDFLRFAGVL